MNATINSEYAWDVGYGMAVKGFTRNTNPYRGTPVAGDWLEGYEAAISGGRWGTWAV